MNDILKREFGFQGFVMSDWGATESTMAAVTGLDVIFFYLLLLIIFDADTTDI